MADPLPIVLLPGLDGTGLLFRPLLVALPDTLEPIVVSYPVKRALGYRELEDFVAGQLPAEGPFALLGESFSGPVAVRLAARFEDRVRGLILVASFVRYPCSGLARSLRLLVRAPLFLLPPPAFLIRRKLVGPDAPAELVDRVRSATALVKPGVLARRVREVLAVDERECFAYLELPKLYLAAAEDRQFPLAVAESLRELRPDLIVESVPAPHLLLQVEPEESARRIAGFFAGLSARSSPSTRRW
jgi:pimeloyl-ACP methyl ester carboxylesterase